MNGNKPLPESETRFAINIIENHCNEILLLKRHMNKRIGPGLWGLPAGHIEPDETPQQCSRRELLEELGPDCTLNMIESIGPVKDTLYGGNYEIHLFHYRWQGGTIRLNHEHTAFAWTGKETYQGYDVVDGVDEDINYFNIWPHTYLNENKLPSLNS